MIPLADAVAVFGDVGQDVDRLLGNLAVGDDVDFELADAGAEVALIIGEWLMGRRPGAAG